MEPDRTASIVLIEDNPGDVILFEEALRVNRIAYRLTRYADGEQALAAFSSAGGPTEPPDLILIDLNLPRAEGLDVLAALQGHPVLGRVATAVLTSSQSPQDEAKATLLGATGFILKPVFLDEFIEGVGQAVRNLLAAQNSAE